MQSTRLSSHRVSFHRDSDRNSHRNASSRFSSGIRALTPLAACAVVALAQTARAQDASGSTGTVISDGVTGNNLSTKSPALRIAAGFLNVGGYYFTSSRATRELGTPKFYNDSQLFVKPKHFRAFELTGGLEVVSAGDHFLPFEGGNEFGLIGPAFRVSTTRALLRPRPFVTGGLFVERARSRTFTPGFDRSNFAPSVSAGVEYPFTRYTTLYAAYRVSQEVHQINTDGVSVGLRFF